MTNKTMIKIMNKKPKIDKEEITNRIKRKMRNKE